MSLAIVAEESDEPASVSASASTFTIVVGLVLVAALVLVARYLVHLSTENQRLREAFTVMREKMDWSCNLKEGERVICAVKEGTLSRLTLAEDDQVVSGKGIASPLGKPKAKTEAKIEAKPVKKRKSRKKEVAYEEL